MALRAAAVGVVLVLAAAAAPDESRVLAQQEGGDLRFAVPVRGADAPGSPVFTRVGPISNPSVSPSPPGYHFRDSLIPGYSRLTRMQVRVFNDGAYELWTDPDPGAAVRQRVENELVVLFTRLNSAGDGLAPSTDTFVVEPRNWALGSRWRVGPDAARGARIQAVLSNSGNRSQWYYVAVDKTVPGVEIDETAQRFLYVPPPPPPPAQVAGVRVSPLDGGLRVSWSAASGEVSQYRVDAVDASGELVRRVYTGADVFEALLDRLVNGVEYTVTVTALTSHPDVEGPASETATATPRAGGDGDTGDVPVPALPLAGAGVLAGLLTSAAYRFRRARRRSSRAPASAA